MKIKLDDKHTLNSDRFCYWITETVMPDDGKPYKKSVSGFQPTFAGAVESYIKNKINSSEAAEICQLKEDVDALIREVRSWKRE